MNQKCSAARSSTASQPAHLSLFRFTAVKTDCSASDFSMKAPVLVQYKQNEKKAPTWQLCGTQFFLAERMAFLGQRSWQNRTAGTCSIHFLQQSNSQAARPVSQEDAEACCLNKLAFDRGRAYSVSKLLFSMQPVESAQQCSGLTISVNFGRVWCLLTSTWAADC